ncbi:MAG: hypothetical protein ABWZ53_13580 [Actinomycetota bacterium]
MTSILVVCSGNICRSPIAEGLLRDALVSRFGSEAPIVSSAGTIAVEGALPSDGSVTAAAERGSDIAAHRARRLTRDLAGAADLVVGMAGEHREWLADAPEIAGRTFTLKELVRLLGSLPPAAPGAGPDILPERVAEASDARAGGFAGNPLDEDIADPLGMPLQTYRAVAWELDEWIDRLLDGLYGTRRLFAAGEG